MWRPALRLFSCALAHSLLALASAGTAAPSMTAASSPSRTSVAQFPKNRIVRVCWPHRAPSATSYPLAPVKVAPSATDR